MDETWSVVAQGQPVASETVAVKGRQIPVPMAACGAARFSFADLCEAPLAARDYLAIAGRYSTILLDRVPVLAEGRRNEAKRFILLIDTLYDNHVRLFVSAEAPPQALYANKRGTEAFEFDRTVSRLIEMQSRDWLEGWAARHEETRHGERSLSETRG
jgi:cell division protein ZapE